MWRNIFCAHLHVYANVYFRLRGWYTAGGHSETVKSLSRAGGGGGGGDFNSPLYSFQEATEARLGEKLNLADSYSVVATINTIRVENSIYKACPVESCKKKVSYTFILLKYKTVVLKVVDVDEMQLVIPFFLIIFYFIYLLYFFLSSFPSAFF